MHEEPQAATFVTEQTRRWFADTSASYALAVIALVEHARDHREVRYAFGPLDSAQMRSSGLAVSGSDEDMAHAVKVLAGIPGLVEEDLRE